MADNLKRLKDGLRIDEHSLDHALRDHPGLFFEIGTALALAISNRDEAKQDLSEVEATVDMELRKSASQIGSKVTEKEIESNRNIDKRVKAANDRFLEEKLNAANLSALKEAYEQKSYALSKLVDLYLANYYSSHEDKKTGGTTLRDARAHHVKEELAERRKRVSP